MKRLLLLFTLLALMFTAISQDLSTDQLLYYPFNGDATNAAVSGANDGTVVGASLVAGFDGSAESAYAFDGINDQVYFGDIDLVDESYTISFWIKLPEVPIGNTSYRLMAQREACTGGTFFDIAFSNTTARGYNIGMELVGNSGAIHGHVNTGMIANPHEWNHITLMKDNDTHNSRAYINGQLVATKAWTSAINLSVSNTAQFGISVSPCIGFNATKHFVGAIDELRMHKRVLTEADLKTLVPFEVEQTFPLNAATKTSVSSSIVLDMTDTVDVSSVTTANISLSATTGSLTPNFVVDVDKIFIDVTGDLPYGEEITVSLSNIAAKDGRALAATSFSFTTATEEESLVARYEFDGNLKDITSNGYDWDINNALTYTSDRLKNDTSAITFTNHFATLPTNDEMNVGFYKDFSISFWMKVPQSSAQRPILDNLSTGRFSVLMNQSGQLTLRLASGEIEEVVTTERYDDNLWHHVTMTGDRDTAYKIYVDGVLAATQAKTHFVNLANLSSWYLNKQSDGNNYFNGSLDDLRFYNRVLPAQEAKTLAPIYVNTTPSANEVAAATSTNITLEFGQQIGAASVIASNFTLTGSKSGDVSFTLSGGDSRVIVIDPDTNFELDETITVTYANLTAENGDDLDGSFTFETADVDKGMLIHYTFEGNADNQVSDQFDGEVIGAQLTNGFDGAANSAYSFNGSHQINIGKLGLDKESFAIAFWMKRDVSTQRGEILGQRASCTRSNFMELSASYSPNTGKYATVLVMGENTGGFKSYVASAEITPEVWAHIVVERDAQAGVIRIYKNGALVQETPYSSDFTILNNATMSLGGGNACIGVDGRGRYRGDLDDLRIYKRTLDPKEIAKLSDFMLESSFPEANATKVPATSSFFINFNDDIDESAFTSGNIDLSGSVSGSIGYTATVHHDTIKVVPDTQWPAGETITVTLTDVPSVTGELLTTSYAFTIASEEESLIIHLPLDGDYTDLSSNEFTFAPGGGISFDFDRNTQQNSAAKWDGGARYIDLQTQSYIIPELMFGTTSDFTMMTWFKAPGVSTQQTFFNKQAGLRRLHAHIKSDGKLALRMAVDNGAVVDEVISSKSYTDNYWHHVAFVADRDGQLKIIVDGQEEAAVDSKAVDMDILSGFRLGATESAGSPFQGVMDDFRLYNKTLTVEEIREIAPTYSASYPADGYNAVELDQEFTLEFLWAVDAATAIPANFTLTGAESGAKTVTVTGGDSRRLTITGDADFVNDEEITLSFTNLVDTLGNAINDRTFTYEATGINKGMFAYYPMSGDMINQLSDNYNGQITGATVAEDRNGNAGEAYSFDGNDYVVLGDMPIADQSFTFSFWLKRDAVQQTQSLFGYRAQCNASPQMNLNCSWSGNLNSYAIGFSTGGINKSGAYQNYGVSALISANTWTHVSVVRDNAAGMLKVYVNGSLEAVQNINAEININNSATLGIAAGNACINVDGTRRFTGDLDEVRIYNRAITDAEAAAMPNLTIDPPTITGTIEAVTLDEDAPATVVAKVDTLFSSTDELTYEVTTASQNITATLDGSNIVIEPVADFVGQAEVTISASNIRKTSQTFVVTIDEVNDAPVVTAGDDLDLPEDFSGVEQISFSYSQPASESGQTVTYSISPDPSTIDFASVGFNQTTGIIIVSAAQDGFGSQVFTVTADDGEAQGSAQATVTVNPVNDAPEFSLSTNQLNLSQNFTEVETVTLTNLSPENETEAITYSIDPVSVAFADVSIDAATGEISISSVTDGIGTQQFTVTADDSQGVANTYSNTFTLTVIENTPPTVAQSIAAIAVDEDGSGVIANAVSSLFTDADGDELTITITADTSGVVPVITGDAATFTLADNYHGSASITLTASDGAAEASIVVDLIVNAINDAPDLVDAVANQNVTEDQAFSFFLPENHFTDLDGDDVSFVSATFVGQEGISGEWLTYDPTTRELSGTPLQANVGTTTVTISVTDGTASASDQFLVMVENVNDAPVVMNALSVNMSEDDPATTVDLSTIFSDEDGDALTFSFPIVDTPKRLEGAIVEKHISADILTITPIANASGTASIAITAWDGQEMVQYNIPVEVTPVNDAPQILDEPTMTLEEDGEAATLDLSTVFEDVDEDELTFGVLDFTSSLISATVDGSMLSVTPQADEFGTVSITLTADDGSVTINYELLITVENVNDLPVVIAEPGLSFAEDGPTQTINLSTVFSDSDGDELTFSIGRALGETAVVSAQISEELLSVTPLANAFGTQQILISASDAEGSVSYTISVTVMSVNDAPVFSLDVSELTLEQDFASIEQIEMTLSNVPSNESDQEVTYSITPDDGSLVNFNMNENTLEITAVAGAFGTQIFTIEANDGQDENNLHNETFTITINELATSILSVDQQKVRVYPNPASSFIMLEGDVNDKVELFDLKGTKLLVGKSNKLINVEHIEKGVYVLRYRSNTGELNIKRVVIKH